jgi:hypothetical protein
MGGKIAGSWGTQEQEVRSEEEGNSEESGVRRK